MHGQQNVKKGSKSSSTAAAVLRVSGVIRLDCRTMFLPVYTRKHHFHLNCTQFPALHCLSEFFLPLLCPQYHFWVNTWTKCTDWKHAGRIQAITEHMLIATPNERLNYSLPIYRRNWHMISMLTLSQQQKWSPCSGRVDDEENISNYRTQCSIYEWIILQQQKKPQILGNKDTLFRL